MRKKVIIGILVFCSLVGCFFAWEAGFFWSKSFKKTYQSAKQGNDWSQLDVGQTFLSGRFRAFGVRRNEDKAIYWLNRAAKQGDPEIQMYVGSTYTRDLQDSVHAIYWLAKAARAGNIDAQRSLGNTYFFGYFVKQDLAKAIYWLTKAAEQGAYLEQCRLGELYYDEGEYQDYDKAFNWMSKAALNGHSRAQRLLGNMYYDGIGTKRIRSMAVTWWRESAKKGDQEAQHNLGLMYYHGVEVEQDFAQAYIWCGLASKLLIAGFKKQQEEAKEIRDSAKKHLSKLQLVEAEQKLYAILDQY